MLASLRPQAAGAIAIAMISGSLLSQTAAAQFVTLDDFSSGNDDAWFRYEPAAGLFGIPNAVFEVANGEYTIRSPGSLSANLIDFLAGSAWDSSRTQPTFSNGTFRVTVRANSDPAGPDVTAIGAFARASITGNIFNDRAYAFSLVPATDDIGIALLDSATVTPLAAGNLPLDFDTDYVMEFSVQGTALTLKVWELGSPEPTDPQLTATDSTLTSGAAGVSIAKAAADAGVISGTFDDFAFLVPSTPTPTPTPTTPAVATATPLPTMIGAPTPTPPLATPTAAAMPTVATPTTPSAMPTTPAPTATLNTPTATTAAGDPTPTPTFADTAPTAGCGGCGVGSSAVLAMALVLGLIRRRG